MAGSSARGKAKKPFVMLSRRAVAGWVAVVFVISAWMFGVGVMVGRGTAPVEFDLDRLKRSIESLRKPPAERLKDGAPEALPQVKEKTTLDFYEVLPKKKEELDMGGIPKAPAVPEKREPAPQKPAEAPPAPKPEKPPEPPAAEPAKSGGPFTVQISSVRSEEEAQRTVERLRARGYAAHVEPVGLAEKGTWYRVRMGEFPTRELAAGTVQKLKKDGFAPIVVPK
jgi:cell division septation protein DedD